MAILREKDSEREALLEPRTVVGRAPSCSIVLDDLGVSGEHARIQWTGHHWEIRDLASRNGTAINGVTAEVGVNVPIAEGDQLAFGSTRQIWQLSDASPPSATARRMAGGEVRSAQDGLLVLPSAERIAATVFQDLEGQWRLEDEGESRPVEDFQVLTVDGEPWILQLPAPSDPTVRVPGPVLKLPDLSLRFRVSRDEEHVEVRVVAGTETRAMPQRRYHYMLLTLARERLTDMNNPHLDPDDQGWMHAEDLCRMLGTDDNHLNVDIYRARKELAALGVQGATGVIERRRTSRQLRIGTSHLVVE
jgi:hypothetical protein